jgi:hypothetical protein
MGRYCNRAHQGRSLCQAKTRTPMRVIPSASLRGRAARLQPGRGTALQEALLHLATTQSGVLRQSP